MKINTIARLNKIKEIVPHECLTYLEALKLAFQKIDQNEVVSSWMDSWEIGGNNPNLEDYVKVPTEGCLSDSRKFPILDSKEATIKRIWSIGGSTGYYGLSWAWSLRGLLDKMVGGVGLNRGRRHPSEVYEGDSIDFWRVIRADKENGDLILFAGMKIPGEAWLEFKVENEEKNDQKCYLVQTATFRPKGIFGRLYWYSLAPFHFFIFRKMAQALAGGKMNR